MVGVFIKTDYSGLITPEDMVTTEKFIFETIRFISNNAIIYSMGKISHLFYKYSNYQAIYKLVTILINNVEQIIVEKKSLEKFEYYLDYSNKNMRVGLNSTLLQYLFSILQKVYTLKKNPESMQSIKRIQKLLNSAEYQFPANFRYAFLSSNLFNTSIIPYPLHKHIGNLKIMTYSMI